MRSALASLKNFALNAGASKRLQSCPATICRTFSYQQPVNTHDRLNSKNSKCVVKSVRNFVADNTQKWVPLADEHNKHITGPQNVTEDNAGSTSVLEPCTEDLSTVAPYFQPSFNFAAYVNNSPTLQELVKLGVDLGVLEKKIGVPEYILQLEFNRDMKAHIRYLHDLGVPSNELGVFITRNPWIFKEDLDDLQVRVNYLQSKKFSTEKIAWIVSKNPIWLSFSTGEIDARLGHFQKTFKLTGDEVRTLAAKRPRLITYNMSHIKMNTFTFKEEMGFSDGELRTLLLRAPKLWLKSNKPLLTVFDYAHNVMKLSHQQILDFPEILRCRPFRVKQRHLFLELLGRAQYDPNLESYISPKSLVSGSDSYFCHSVAKSTVEAFNIFLKSV